MKLHLLTTLWILFALTHAQQFKYPSLTISADQPYDIGYETGKTFRSRIQGFFSEFPSLNQTMLPWKKNFTSQYNEFYQTCERYYPDAMEELRGLAQGANVPFEHLFLLNIGTEISLILQNKVIDGSSSFLHPHCTDIHIRNSVAGNFIEAHNEDAIPLVRKYGYLLNLEYRQGSVKKMWGFAYPGQFIGQAFGFNDKGLSFSYNAVFPKKVAIQNARPFNFVTRNLMFSQNLEHARQKATVFAGEISSGFSANIGSIHEDNKILNIEVGPGHLDFNVLRIESNYSHVNEYKRLTTPQYPDPSSFYRQQRVYEFSTPTDVDDARAILGDTKNKDYPIYRNGNGVDIYATAASGIFDLGKKQFLFFSGNPKTTNPAMIIDMETFQAVA